MTTKLSQQTSRISLGGASVAPSYHSIAEGSDLLLSSGGSDGDSLEDVNPSDAILDDVPPEYSPSTFFAPTLFFQIETRGKKLVSLPLAQVADPIPINRVNADGVFLETKFVSIRPSRRSGSCTLVDGSDNSQVRSTTTYRFGPGRSPRVKLLPPPILAGVQDTVDLDLEVEDEDGETTVAGWDDFELKGSGLLTRAVAFKTRLGSFEWRYATRKERKVANADSLLVLDKVAKIALAQNQAAGSLESSSSSKDEEVRTPVAHFVRNDMLRTTGTNRSAAGNGGRLMIDIGAWTESQKVEREMVVILAVTSCVSMLKKEVDRRRTQQMAVMMAVASGGAG